MLEKTLLFFPILLFVISLLSILHQLGASDNDIPIALQILGFILFLPFITNKIAKFVTYSPNKPKEYFYEYNKLSIRVYAIVIIILGYLMQTDFFNELIAITNKQS